MELISTPKIRFPHFDYDWRELPLSKLLVESKKRNFESLFRREDVLSVSAEFGIVNQIKHLGRSYAGESILNYRVVETGDFVYTKSPLKANPYGIIKLNKGPAGLVSTLYAVYRTDPSRCFGPFLDYYFSLDDHTNKYLRPLVRKGAKNDMKINNSDVLVDRIFVPKVQEQQKIALFLSALDGKLEQLARKSYLLRKYRDGVIQQIFNQKIRLKESQSVDFPEWEETPLSKFLVPTPREVKTPSGPYLAIGVRSHFKGTFQKRNSDPTKIEMETLFTVRPGDLIVNITFAWEGALAIAKAYDDGGLVSHRFPTYTFNEKFTGSEFFQYIYSTARFKHLLKLISPGGAGRNRVLNKKDFLRLKVLLPSVPEQTEIIRFLKALDLSVESVNAQLEKTKQFKKGLLQQMFV
jgi:type I restriction enzyme, S subunit